MKTLIIDSTVHGMHRKNSSLHVRNSYILKDLLNADIIPSHWSALEHIQGNLYDNIVFVYASGQAKSSYIIDYLLKNHEKQNGNVKYYYICNDYAVGENTIVWALSYKHGIKYDVIANHKAEYNVKLRGINLRERISNWHVVNLNSLIYDDSIGKYKENTVSSFFNTNVDHRQDIIYFGAFRKGRIKYFKKYFDKDFCVSTSKKNVKRYNENGIFFLSTDRINWHGSINSLHKYKSSLYLEDEATHNWYSCFANRYYEALSFHIPSFFDKSCMNTIEKSGYEIDDFFIVDSKVELRDKLKQLKQLYNYDLTSQKQMAKQEKIDTLNSIKEIIG